MTPPNLPFGTFFGAAVIRAGLPFAILFFVVGLAVDSLMDKDDLWLGIWIGGTVAAVFLAALGNQSACRKQMEGTIRFLGEKLKKIDFWKISRGSGVAIDVEAGKIAIEGIADRKIVHAVVSLDQVRDIQAVAANRTEYTSIGPTSSSTKAEIAKKNFDEDVRAAHNTGLVFKLDDFNTPSVLVILPFPAAERWMLLFEKMFNDTLETTPEPIELPTQ